MNKKYDFLLNEKYFMNNYYNMHNTFDKTNKVNFENYQGDWTLSSGAFKFADHIFNIPRPFKPFRKLKYV